MTGVQTCALPIFSLSLLRLIQIKSMDDNPSRMIIFVTAMTHAAIDACMTKLKSLMLNYQSLRGYDTNWMKNVSLERVMSGTEHPPPDTGKTYIYAGTVYQASPSRSFTIICNS